MTKQLHVARELHLPLDAVTQKIAILGTSGSGKSYCMTKLAEQMLDAKAQVVIIDPKAEAWGLRLKADGKTPAYDIPVLGGEHGDAPLRADMGARVAELIVANDYSMILDVSEFIPQEWAQFCYEFGTRLLQLKKQKKSAMCLMIDEAHDFIPQNPDEKGWMPKMLGAMQRIQKLGRGLGIGMVLASQRPQDVSKKALDLCELWINFQIVGTRSRESVIKTIGEKDSEAASALDSLFPTLEIGRAYVWSPRWLKVKGVYHVLQKTTFDSSATPEVGAKAVEPRKLSPVDLEALTDDLREVIEEAEANDPERLKREKAELAREVAGLKRALEKAERQTTPAEVAVIKPAELKRIEALLKKYEDLCSRADDLVGKNNELAAKLAAERDALGEQGQLLQDALARATRRPAPAAAPARPAPGIRATSGGARVSPASSHFERRRVPPAGGDTTGGTTINATQQRILDALAFYESIGIREPTNVQVGAVAMIDPSGGYFGNTVGPLSTAGLIVRLTGRLRLTDAGRARARVPEDIGTLDDYHNVLRARVLKLKNAGQRTVDMLNVIIARGGAPLTTEEIGREVGIDPTGGYFGNTIGPLGTVGLIERERGVVRPTETLFPEGLH